jgi:hypothetical protein
MFEVVTRDPDFLVDMFLHAMADTGNPYYAWQALSVCLKHKKEIPDWLAAYLEQCIERMEADRARRLAIYGRFCRGSSISRRRPGRGICWTPIMILTPSR